MRSWLLAFLVFCLPFNIAQSELPLEAFATLPDTREMEISPDGTRLAYLTETDGEAVLVVGDIATMKPVTAVKFGEVKVSRLDWSGNKYILLYATETTRDPRYLGKVEKGRYFAVDVERSRTKGLLDSDEGGAYLGPDPGGDHGYFIGAVGGGNNPFISVVRVSLRHGQAREHIRGDVDTGQWLISDDGKAIARADFRQQDGLYVLKARQGNDWVDLLTGRSSLFPYSIIGLTADKQELYVVDREDADGDGTLGLYRIGLSEGARLEGPVALPGDISDVIKGSDKVVKGIRHPGLTPSYTFFDEGLEADWAFAEEQLAGSSLDLVSWSDDFSKILFLAEAGAGGAGKYILFDRTARGLSVVGEQYSTIPDDQVGGVFGVKFKARDGMTIPMVLTLPPGIEPASDLKRPTIMLPHGGPESHDEVGFDWMAQFFVNRGYVVLQPNFRGSSGFGAEFRDAGYGEFGGKMQDDVTDALDMAIRQGWTDPERVCIVGWSYGGYAALAGGAFTPEKYSCVVAGAPVADPLLMLTDLEALLDDDGSTLTYWARYIGDVDRDRDRIQAISPTRHADKFQSPVLLIHGRDDIVVDINQSMRMNDRLKDARKDVKLVRLDKADHWLSRSATRKAVLEAMESFVDEHIGD